MPFSEARADHALEFVSLMPHVKGPAATAGLTFGDTMLDFQRESIRELFGRVKKNGKRQYQLAFWYRPKKNGKSTEAAAIGTYGLFGTGEAGPEVYLAAEDRDQASYTFEIVAGMVAELPELLALSRIRDHLKTISYPGQRGFLKAIASDHRGAHGISPSLTIFDEIHTQRDRKLWDVLRQSAAARAEPLIIVITHAGYGTKGIGFELYEHAKAVSLGEREDPTIYPVLFEAERDEDWTDPAVWRKANPGLGVTVQEDFLEAECRRAQQMPSYQNSFRRFHLNQWVEQAERWMPMEKWDLGAAEPDRNELVGAPCFAGLDLSSTTDLTSMALVFPHEDGMYDVLLWYWCPEDNAMERADRDKVPYLDWIDQDLICATPGAAVDYAFIRACLVGPDPLVRQAAAVAAAHHRRFDPEEALWRARSRLSRAGLPPDGLAARYRIQEIAYDPWNATQLAIQLEEEDGFRMVQFRQGYSTISAPTKELEALVLSKRLRHGGHPILRWNTANVVCKEDPGGNLMPEKKKSADRIDGLVALIMGLGASMLHREEPESDGWLVLPEEGASQ